MQCDVDFYFLMQVVPKNICERRSGGHVVTTQHDSISTLSPRRDCQRRTRNTQSCKDTPTHGINISPTKRDTSKDKVIL